MSRLRTLSTWLTVALLVTLLAGCTLLEPLPDGGIDTPTAQPVVADPSLFPEMSADLLADATYLSEFGADGTITLVNGVYSAPAAAGSASRILVTTGWPPVLGDLNGDGVNDAAVILVVSAGGSGTFYYLHAMINQPDGPVNAAFNFLGDRIVLHSVTIEAEGRIVLAARRQGPDDPMCCPSQEVIQTYELQGNKLPLIDEVILTEAAEATSVEAAPQPDPAATPTSVPAEAPADEASSSAEAARESAIPGQELADVEWLLVSYGPEDAPRAVLDGTRIAIRFTADGSISGVAGCNNYVSGYRTDDGGFTIAPPGLTRRSCPGEGVMAQEAAYVEALAGARSVEVVEGQLRIDYGDGVLVYVPVEQ